MSEWNSEHFERVEFACKCGCGFDTADFELVRALDYLRNHFDARVTITSGCRCEKHNRAVGGSRNSQHLAGRAADIVVDGIPPELVAELAEQIEFGGIGRYEKFTHVDTRTGRARWSEET